MVNQTDVSNNIFSLSGLEYRRSDQGGIVIGELSFESDRQFELNDTILILNDQNVSIAKYYITSKTFLYESRIWQYNCTDWLKKLDLYSLSIEEDYQEAMTGSGLVTFATFSNDGQQTEIQGPYISLTTWLKYSLSRILDDDYNRIITPDWEPSYLDFRCSIYNSLTNTNDNRNVFQVPYARLAFAPIDFFNIGYDNITFISSLLIFFGLYIVFYNDRYYIKKISSFTQPNDDNIYEYKVEQYEKEKYDSVMIKKNNETEVYYPKKMSNFTEVTKPSFLAIGFFQITVINYPYNIYLEDGNIDSNKLWSYCAMSSGTVDLNIPYYMESENNEFVQNYGLSPTIGYNSADMYIYFLYFLYHNYYGSSEVTTGNIIHPVKTIRKEIKTNLKFWDSISVEPIAVSIELEQDTKMTNYEVLI